jgi:Cd2+/Zn2+-exporting ATPase/Cu+-exporting ATPase
MLASIGSSAQRGLLFKGGKYIESLEKADTIFIDKTGTLTIGKPTITDIFPLGKHSEMSIIQYCASAERYSEHPLAESVLRIADEKNIKLLPVKEFMNIPGTGIHAEINDKKVAVVNKPKSIDGNAAQIWDQLRKDGKTTLFLQINDENAGILGAEDVLRVDVSNSIQNLRRMGIKKIKLISGDNHHAVKKIAKKLNIDFQGEMSPEEKIDAIGFSQSNGEHVVMIGDGINDAPALAQADVGISMGKTGSDIAIETSHIALLREDWSLIPDALRIAKRTMKIVRMNILFTGIYNLVGLLLAAAGFLPPTVSAAMQSIPDVGIMVNSARLLHHPVQE